MKQLTSLDELRRRAAEHGHLLEWTLQDMTDDLSAIYDNIKDRSLYPNQPLKACVACCPPQAPDARASGTSGFWRGWTTPSLSRASTARWCPAPSATCSIS
jgi:hypothetical protein